MKFVSTTGEDIHIALPSGHTALIPAPGPETDGVELPIQFRREAIARGAVAVGIDMTETPQAAPLDRTALITKAITEMLDGSDEADFTSDGKPNLIKLAARVGFRVAREEADKIFDAITKGTDEAPASTSAPAAE
ncbi:hypothetical protein PSQ40_04925 [Curvibacter sp. HBC61]|uniref:Tail assembly chaperone n=1 Tax=Curvibacter cyanobacteriorum TaxID=3026422 RepID=A0ABT5MX47_9BURK|nr:hypothetical protein [Curvibacter sp. HBC61]MDD0837909.1 hypothetical protein [Curvibacter sp. HBC61]